MDARIIELEIAAVTRKGELGAVVWPMPSLKCLVAASEDRGNTAEARA